MNLILEINLIFYNLIWEIQDKEKVKEIKDMRNLVNL